MKKILVVLMLVIMTGVSYSTATITTTGEGMIQVKPNMAEIYFGVISKNKVVKIAKDDNDKRSNILIDSLLKNGVEKKDLETTSYNIFQREEYINGKKDGENYIFEVRNEFKLKVKDLNKVSKILGVLGNNGANNIKGITYTREDLEDLKVEVLKDAYLDAKEKAKALAEIEGYGVEISQINTSGYMPRPQMYAARNNTMETKIINPQSIEVRGSVTAQFNMIKK